MKPSKLPSIFTSNTTRAKAKTTVKISIPTSIALVARLPSRTIFESGAARNRRHRPRCRSSNRPMPTSMLMKSMNWIAMPPKEWAYEL